MTSTTSYKYKSMKVLTTDLEPGEHTITITHTGDDGTDGVSFTVIPDDDSSNSKPVKYCVFCDCKFVDCKKCGLCGFNLKK